MQDYIILDYFLVSTLTLRVLKSEPLNKKVVSSLLILVT